MYRYSPARRCAGRGGIRLPGLPAGARAFVTDPAHKDLKLTTVRFGRDLTELRFRYNESCDTELTIRYLDVHTFALDVDRSLSVLGVDEVILDEILPHERGCSHEIEFHTGTLMVVCRDLIATWGNTPSI